MVTAFELSEAEVEELLGAYVLDACVPEEVAAIEAVLTRRPDLAREAERLATVAAWLGAAEAIEPPGRMRERVLDAALARRGGAADPVIDVYVSLSDRFVQAVVELPDDALDVVTPNGLTAHDLVVHMAAQESLLAQNLGDPTIDELDEDDIVARTHALLPRFAGRDLDDAIALWRAVGGDQPDVGRRQPRPHRDLARPRAHPRRHPARRVRSRRGCTPTTCAAPPDSRAYRPRSVTCR